MGCIVFGNRSEKVTEEWRKPHELNDMHFSPNIVRGIRLRGMRWPGHVARMEENLRVVHRDLLGKPERKRPLGRPIRNWKDNIKMKLRVLATNSIRQFPPSLIQPCITVYHQVLTALYLGTWLSSVITI